MEPPSTLTSEIYQRMSKHVKGLMLCRIIILTLLLTITFLFQISEKRYFFIPLTNQFYYFIGLFYLVTIVYALFLKKVYQDAKPEEANPVGEGGRPEIRVATMSQLLELFPSGGSVVQSLAIP
jgi:magnesium-transporting ATPase (P-type)